MTSSSNAKTFTSLPPTLTLMELTILLSLAVLHPPPKKNILTWKKGPKNTLGSPLQRLTWRTCLPPQSSLLSCPRGPISDGMEVPTGLSCGWSTELFLDGPSRGCEGGSSHSCPLGLPGLWDLSKAEPLLQKHPGKKGSLCLPLNPRDLKAKLCKALEAKWEGRNKSWVGAGEKVLQNLKGFKSGKCIPEKCPGELHWPQQPLICKHGVFPLLFPFLKVPALLVTHSTNISAPLCEPGSMTL